MIADIACDEAAAAVAAAMRAEPSASIVAALAHLSGCPRCRVERLMQRIQLTRRALRVALPSPATTRSDSAQSFVVFDHSAGEPPRRVLVSLREQGLGTWEMQVVASPPADAVVLVSIGTKSFAARLAGGTARINGIPERYVTDIDAPDIEMALVYPGEAR